MIDQLKSRGLPVERVADYTAVTDPNGKLGQPGQYVAKSDWHDTRLSAGYTGTDGGGTLEVFANPADAQARYDFIKGTENDYLRGLALIRVTTKLTDAQASEYDAATRSLAP